MHIGDLVCQVRLLDGSGMNWEVHVPFCEKLAGKLRRFTLHSLHYVLDIAFRDDESRIRKGNAPMNIGIIKHAALNMLRKNQRKRESIKGLRKVAGWDNQRLSEIIF